MNKPTRNDKARARRIQAHDVKILEDLARRMNNRPMRWNSIDIAYRYLRRFYGVLPWHRGGHHVARYNGGPMLYQGPLGLFSVDPREAAT